LEASGLVAERDRLTARVAELEADVDYQTRDRGRMVTALMLCENLHGSDHRIFRAVAMAGLGRDAQSAIDYLSQVPESERYGGDVDVFLNALAEGAPSSTPPKGENPASP